jgi:hypothetical protein
MLTSRTALLKLSAGTARTRVMVTRRTEMYSERHMDHSSGTGGRVIRLNRPHTLVALHHDCDAVGKAWLAIANTWHMGSSAQYRHRVVSRVDPRRGYADPSAAQSHSRQHLQPPQSDVVHS